MSRPDSVGLFWEDVVVKGARNVHVRPMPPIPMTGWKRPTEFPNLRFAECIAIDLETKDPSIENGFGPGWARREGHIVGVAIGVPGGGRWYFPIRHETEAEDNFDPDMVLAWLRDVLSNPLQAKVGANIMYDVGWLAAEGVEVKGDLIDVQLAEALLAEGTPVALDYLGEKYLGEPKTSETLYKFLADWHGGAANDKIRKFIYKAPPRLVGPYAEGDVDLPLRIIACQYPHLQREGLLPVFAMECGLIPLLISMRMAGVSVDIGRAEEVRDTLGRRIKSLQEQLDHMCGCKINVNAGATLARGFDNLGLKYKRTKPTAKAPTGKPSFTKEFMKTIEHPVGRLIDEVKLCSKMQSTFIESYILNSHKNGKVYGEFHLLKGESGGTRSGRFSSSNPNLQNIPSRDPELGPLLRSMFVPDEGHFQWRKYDYSQIEYRLLAHHAVGDGANELRRVYNEDPDTDYHVLTQKLVEAFTGQKIDRKPIKNINFGLIYGMGVNKLARSLGLSEAEGKKLFAAYHEAAPFAKATMEQCSNEAAALGVISTVLGRRSRFDTWEPLAFEDRRPGLPYHRALREYGQIKRAGLHKALNRKLQGGAADLMKFAMWRCWTDGVFAETGVPRLTVHDELDFSDPGGKEDAFREMQHIMETAIRLNVPVKADFDIGPNWGHTKSPLAA